MRSPVLMFYNSIKNVSFKQNPHCKLDSKESEDEKMFQKSFVSWVAFLYLFSCKFTKWHHAISTISMDSIQMKSIRIEVTPFELKLESSC